MHELSIAESIMAIAERHAEGRPVRRVEVKVGHLRQVVPSALQFAFELLNEGTVMDGAELVLEDVPARGRCRACGADGELPALPFSCAACGGLDIEVTAGEELIVDALELEEEHTLSATGGRNDDG